jgi:hypothetical protein
MKAGAYRTDPLSRIVFVGAVRDISGAAEPGAKDGRSTLNRPHPLTRTAIPAAALSRVGRAIRKPFYQMMQETLIRQYIGQSRRLEFYSNY